MLNYGLYLLPSVPGKLGKYMDDGRCLGDYVLHGHVPRLEVSIIIIVVAALQECCNYYVGSVVISVL